jgi:hypothetical protein
VHAARFRLDSPPPFRYEIDAGFLVFVQVRWP